MVENRERNGAGGWEGAGVNCNGGNQLLSCLQISSKPSKICMK